MRFLSRFELSLTNILKLRTVMGLKKNQHALFQPGYQNPSFFQRRLNRRSFLLWKALFAVWARRHKTLLSSCLGITETHDQGSEWHLCSRRCCSHHPTGVPCIPDHPSHSILAPLSPADCRPVRCPPQHGGALRPSQVHLLHHWQEDVCHMSGLPVPGGAPLLPVCKEQ